MHTTRKRKQGQSKSVRAECAFELDSTASQGEHQGAIDAYLEENMPLVIRSR